MGGDQNGNSHDYLGWKKWVHSALWSMTGTNVISGTISGVTGVLAGHPFDTVKVRLQSQECVTGSSRYFGNTWRCFESILREEGPKGLLRGVTSPLIGVTIINTFLFGVYGFFLDFQARGNGNSDGGGPTLAQIFIAGSLSGLVNSIISCPVELAKIQLQNQSTKKGEHQTVFRSPWQCLYQIFNRNGIPGVYRGFLATIWRETPSYGVYFASFEWLRQTFENNENPKYSNCKLMFAGGLSGIAAWLSTYPMDVIKTKIQAQNQIEGNRKGNPTTRLGIITSWRDILKNDGHSGLFRGVSATIIRAFPTNAVIFFTYAWTKRWLEECNPKNSVKEF